MYGFAADTYQSGYISGNGRFRGVYSSEFNGIRSIRMDWGLSTYFDADFYGVAATGNGFATVNVNIPNEIQFWGDDGLIQGTRTFNAPNYIGNLYALEYDEASGAFWIADSNGLQTLIRRYGATSPDPEWPVLVNGQVLDMAYVPIPAPASLMLAGAGVVLAARRRRC